MSRTSFGDMHDVVIVGSGPSGAAAGYYLAEQGLEDRVEAHFEGVPLPGYGWIFPLSRTTANVGVGFWSYW